jgi:hypothetical protein
MTVLAQRDLNAILPSVRRSTLTKEQVFRLWRCATKDDNKLVDEMIQHVYEDMITFDCKRAECVMELIVKRDIAARCAFGSLLKDMRAVPRALPARLDS